MAILLRQFQLISLILLLGLTVWTQQTDGSLHISVIDQNRNFISTFTARIKKGQQIVAEVISKDNFDVVFSKIEVGSYILEIESEGFKPQSLEVKIKSERSKISVILKIAEIVENVKIDLAAKDQRVEESFNNFLTAEQIAALPDDPREMEAALRRIAGDNNVVIRVDGFSGGRLPIKSQIASVRIVRSSYDAEHHELGMIYVDVVTKVGSRRFSGSISFDFNDEAFNARNAFAKIRFPEQNRNTFFYLSGPIKENKTDFSLVFTNSNYLKSQNIVAFLPDGIFKDSINSLTSSNFLDLRVNHNLTKNLPIKLSYQFSDGISNNLGIGDFNLPDKAFDLKTRSQEFRFSTVGYFANKFLNEFRVQYKEENLRTIPQSEETSVIVLDSFRSGGAGNFQRNLKRSFWLADNLLFGFKKHALKFGGTISFENEKQDSAYNQNGTFIFSTLQDFSLGRPSIFSRSLGIRKAEVLQYQIGLFVQDDIQIRKNFIASFGLRYEWQNNINDNNNFSPRLAFSWSPFKDGRTTLRLGAGLFYNWLEIRNLLAILSQDNTQPGEIIIINPSYPIPFSSDVSRLLPPSFTQKAEDLDNPYVFHTSFIVQQRISEKTNFRAEYIYQKGLHQFRSRDINAPFEGIRPDSDFGRIVQIESSAFFSRNSIVFSLDGNLTKKVFYTFNYNLSKVISDSNGFFGLPSDSYDLRNDISEANDDQRHRFSSYLSWQIKKGLRFSTIYSAKSPLPYTITTGQDNNNDTVFNDRPFNFGRNSERGTWYKQLDISLSYIFSFINRNNGKSNKDFSIVTTSSESGYDFTDAEKRFSLRFFANAGNVLNQNNLNNFVGVQTSPFFRQATSAKQARKITFGIRFNF